MGHQVHTIAFAASLLGGGVAGCHLILGIDGLESEEPTGQGGSSTEGGSTSTSASTGGGTSTEGGSSTTSTGGEGGATITGGGGAMTTTSTPTCTATTGEGCGGPDCVQCDLGESCLIPSDCLSGHCVDGVCCNELCDKGCYACSNFKKGGAGMNGTCELVYPGEEPDSDCPAPGEVCDGLGGCKLADGQACAAGGECASSVCVDGFCCDSACAGACRACNVPGMEGKCTFHAVGSDPENDCPDPNVCLGRGSCGPP